MKNNMTTNMPKIEKVNTIEEKEAKELEEQSHKNFAITFCDQAESGGSDLPHAGEMVQPGEGFTLSDLQRMQESFPNHPYKLIDIRTELLRGVTGQDAKSMAIRKRVAEQPSAYLLVICGGGRTILGGDTSQMFKQLLGIPWDKKTGPRKKGGTPLNKHARYNINFGQEATAPDYSIGQTTVISFSDSRISELHRVKGRLEKLTGQRLVAEGNYYYKEDSGIRYHGDTTRRRVIGLRFGAPRRIHFQHFLKSMPVGANGAVNVRDGDLYVFSEHAVGTDWKKRSGKLTLRHAAGIGHWTIKDGKNLWVVENFEQVYDSKPHNFDYVGDVIWTPPTGKVARKNYFRRKEAFEKYVSYG